MAATATSNPHSGRKKKAAAAASSNKNKDKWTNTEQKQFQKGIIKHGWGNWKILLEENIITTRDRSQIKSRAQKLQKNHPNLVADLIRQHEAHKNASATKSVVNKVGSPTSKKPSTTTTTAPTTKKKKAPQRRRGSTSSVKCKSPVSSQAASVSTITTTTTNKMRRRGSCPGNLGMEGRVVCKLQPGGGAIAKRRGSLRKFICNLCVLFCVVCGVLIKVCIRYVHFIYCFLIYNNYMHLSSLTHVNLIIYLNNNTGNSLRASFKLTPPSPSTPNTKKQSVSPQSPVEQHLDISPDVTSVTAGVNSVNLGMDTAAAAAAAVVITPNASSNPSPTDFQNFMMPIAQQQDKEATSEEEEEDELAALAKVIKEPSWKLKPTFSNHPSDNTTGSDDASFNSTSVHDGGSDNRSVNMNIDDLGDFDLENILVETSNNSPEKKEEEDKFIELDVDKDFEDINMEPLPKDDDNTTAVEEKHLKTIAARFVDPRWNTVMNAPQGLTRNQTMSFGMPSSPNIRPEQNLYMSIHAHLTGPPNFSDPKEYMETQNGLTRIAKDTGTVCRARIKSLLNEHLEMGWWREDYINPVNNTNDTQMSFGQNDGKKFGLERLVALTAVMLDVDNWHAINKVATAATSPFANVASLSADDEDDIRHVGQLISGLWERVIRALERGHAFPGNEASRITAINIAVARLDWYSRKEQQFQTAHQPMSH